MRTTGRNVSYYLIVAMSLALMGFTASRTVDLLQQILPAGQQLWSILGVVAFDLGLLAWSLFYAHGAQGQQRSIALAMVVVDMLAVGVSTLADLYIGASGNGLVSALPEQARVGLLVAVGAIILANMCAFFLAHINDPERAREIAILDAKAAIFEEQLRQIRRRTPQVASHVSPILADAWARDTADEFVAGTGSTLRLNPPKDAEPIDDDAPWYSNGRLPAVSAKVVEKSTRTPKYARRTQAEIAAVVQAYSSGDYTPKSRQERHWLNQLAEQYKQAKASMLA